MLSEETRRKFFNSINRRLVKILILAVASVISLLTLVLPIASRPNFVPFVLGSVAPQDIQAPGNLSYPSEVLTEQARNDAENLVQNSYLPVDPSITRRQIELLRSALNFISTVRADSYATIDLKRSDMAALESIQLSREDAEQILLLSDSRWQMTQQEALSVLEQIMRESIRDTNLRDIQRRVPTLISFSLPQDLAVIVTNLVTPFVVPNSLYSPELTEIARQEARNRVSLVTKSYAAGETIVRRGQIITPAHWEAMEMYGLIRPNSDYRDWLAPVALIAVLSMFAALYFSQRKLSVMNSLRVLALIAITFLIFLYAARLINPNRTVLPYAFPVPAFGLTIASLFHPEVGMILSLLLSIMAAFGMPNSLDLTLYYFISSLFGIMLLGKGQRIGSFIAAGFGIGAAGSVIILAYRLVDSNTDLIGLVTLVGAAIFNGLASASLTLILQFLFAQMLGLATALQLLEFSRPDHPLQQFILQNAPGSFQHSLQVAIMAEQAAEKVGADTLLVRVGAIYHDAGKALNPSFFIENQIPGKLNPHDDLDPVISAQTIIRHVSDGVQLARKYRLPSRIVDFMREHHGTIMTRYQYAKALEAAGGNPDLVDINLFRYPGPRPQSKETAILMLSDGTQARARAELPQNEDEMRDIVRKVIDFCQREGQLDDTRLTLRDLSIITESFIKTLQNTYHPRIRYPEVALTAKGTPTTEPAADTAPLRAALPEPTEVVTPITEREEPTPVIQPSAKE